MLPPVWASLALCAALGWWSRDFYTVDMKTFLVPWLDHIRAVGAVRAFAQPFSDYTPPYLYLLAAIAPLTAWLSAPAAIKLLSFAGNLVLAGAVRHLLGRLDMPQRHRAAALFLVAPSLLANAALLHQCDALWSAAIVMALAAAIDRRHLTMFVWCGIGVAFKAQAALAAPFFLALALARGVPFRQWLVAPAAAAAPMIPALLAGWPPLDLATIYWRQAGTSNELSRNAPNVWGIMQALLGQDAAVLGGLAFAAAIGGVCCYVAAFSVRLRHAAPTDLVAAAALAPMLAAGLLPRMHERYFFLADVLTLVLALARPAEWRVAVYAQLGSCLAILAYLSGRLPTASVLMIAAAIAMIAATWLVARPMLARPANDNPQKLSPAVG